MKPAVLLKIFGPVFIAAGALLMLTIACGCGPSEKEQMQARLEQFTSILPDNIRTDFQNKNYEQAVIRIDSLLTADPGFASRWAKMKKAEAIDLFDTAEVVAYFADHFIDYGKDR